MSRRRHLMTGAVTAAGAASGRRRAPIRILLWAAATAWALLPGMPVRGGVAHPSKFHVESTPTGELSVVAQGVPIVEALDAVANEAGFAVSAYQAPARPPLTLTLPRSSVDRVLREMLRGRNYALVYDSETDALTKVILLAPASASRSRAPARPPARRAAQAQRRAPVVVRR